MKEEPSYLFCDKDLEFKQREGEGDTERDRWDVICWY
jgi:hypothetical protein